MVVNWKDLERWEKEGFKKMNEGLFVKKSFLRGKYLLKIRCASCGSFNEIETRVNPDRPTIDFKCEMCEGNNHISLRRFVEATVRKLEV